MKPNTYIPQDERATIFFNSAILPINLLGENKVKSLKSSENMKVV